MSFNLSSLTSEQIAAMNLSAMTPDQLAAIFNPPQVVEVGTVERPAVGFAEPAPTPKVENVAPVPQANIMTARQVSAAVTKVDAWLKANNDWSATRTYQPLGHRGLKANSGKGGGITRSDVVNARSLRLKLNVAFACGKQVTLTDDERKAAVKWASGTGTQVAGFEAGKPWIISARAKKDGALDGRAGSFFQAGGKVEIDRNNLVRFVVPSAKKDEFVAMQAKAAELLK